MVELDLEHAQAYIDRHYTGKTKEQYTYGIKRFNSRAGTEVNQKTIDTYLKVFANNPLNRAVLKLLVNCFKLKDIDLPKPKSVEKQRKIKFLTKKEINYMVRNLPDRVSLMVRIAFQTGMRLSELVNIKQDNIDLINCTITGMGKRKKEFTEEISKKTAKLLGEYLDYHSLDDYPFHYEGIKHHDKKFWKELKDECAKIGLQVTPHKIRHALGHHLKVDLDWDLEAVRLKLRHDNITTTVIYATEDREKVSAMMKRDVFGEKEEKEND